MSKASVESNVPPMSDLCLTLMDKLGVHVDTLGDSNGPLDLDVASTVTL
jgi:hypothetical protein